MPDWGRRGKNPAGLEEALTRTGNCKIGSAISARAETVHFVDLCFVCILWFVKQHRKTTKAKMLLDGKPSRR